MDLIDKKNIRFVIVRISNSIQPIITISRFDLVKSYFSIYSGWSWFDVFPTIRWN